MYIQHVQSTQLPGRLSDLASEHLGMLRHVKPWVFLRHIEQWIAKPSWVGLGDELTITMGQWTTETSTTGSQSSKISGNPSVAEEHGKCDVTCKSQRPTYDDRMALGPEVFCEADFPVRVRKSCHFFGTFSKSKRPKAPPPGIPMPPLARQQAWLCWIIKGWWWYGGYS